MEDSIMGFLVGILICFLLVVIITTRLENNNEKSNLSRWAIVDEKYEKMNINYEKWSKMDKFEVENLLFTEMDKEK